MTTPNNERREEIARMVAPRAFHSAQSRYDYDRNLRSLGRQDAWATFAFVGPTWLTQVQEAYATADAILSLPPLPPGGEEPVAMPTRQDVMRLWRKHGGGQHGPRVETVTMPLDSFHDFIQDVLALVPAAPPAPTNLQKVQSAPASQALADQYADAGNMIEPQALERARRNVQNADAILGAYANPGPAEAQARVDIDTVAIERVSSLVSAAKAKAEWHEEEGRGTAADLQRREQRLWSSILSALLSGSTPKTGET